jgi:SAM-dependent methyltransferase
MANVNEHYENFLSGVYSWMQGGYNQALEQNRAFFVKHSLNTPSGSGIALDLGAGCGFQSIPLADFGYTVMAVDTDAGLLEELKANCNGLPITCLKQDISNISSFISAQPEIVICMTDTVLHLESKEQVTSLLKDVFRIMQKEGSFVITFRDLTHELQNTDRFIPVNSDETHIFTCFLEYEDATVKVHDILHVRQGDCWEMRKSFYRKLRLSEAWFTEELINCGFHSVTSSNEKGLITVIAEK